MNMKRIVSIIAATFTLMGLSSPAAIGTVLDGPVVDPANGYSYYLLNNSDWTDAQATAQSMGGNLATVENAAENNWILNTFGGYGGVERFLLIGFTDPSQDKNGGSHASNFVWVDGEPVNYTNWNAGEPNNEGGDEFWTEMYPAEISGGPGVPAGPAGTWNDVPDVSDPYNNSGTEYAWGPVYGVVEVVPEPASVPRQPVTDL